MPAVEREDFDPDHVGRLAAPGDVLNEDDEPFDLADRLSLAGVVVGKLADSDGLDVTDLDRWVAFLGRSVTVPRLPLVRGATADPFDYPRADHEDDEQADTEHRLIEHTETGRRVGLPCSDSAGASVTGGDHRVWETLFADGATDEHGSRIAAALLSPRPFEYVVTFSFSGSTGDGSSDPLHIAVIRAVAAHRNVDPIELPPLYDWINPDSLDALFEPTRRNSPRRGRLEFTYDGHAVAVDCADGVTISVDGSPAAE